MDLAINAAFSRAALPAPVTPNFSIFIQVLLRATSLRIVVSARRPPPDRLGSSSIVSAISGDSAFADQYHALTRASLRAKSEQDPCWVLPAPRLQNIPGRGFKLRRDPYLIAASTEFAVTSIISIGQRPLPTPRIISQTGHFLRGFFFFGLFRGFLVDSSSSSSSTISTDYNVLFRFAPKDLVQHAA